MLTSPSRIPIPSSRRSVSPSSSSTTSTRSKIPGSPNFERSSTPSTRCAQSLVASISSRSLLSPKASSSEPIQRDQSLEATSSPPHQDIIQLPRSNISSPYVSAHLGEPCTIGSLDHLLSCGHKVITHDPEHCGSNCAQPHTELANPRGMDEPFICMACITQKIREWRAEKVRIFEEDLKRVAKAFGETLLRETIAQRIEKIESGWKLLEFDEIDARAQIGRFSWPFYVDPEYAEAVETVLTQRIRTNLTTELPVAQEMQAVEEDFQIPETSIADRVSQLVRTNSKLLARTLPSARNLTSRTKSKLSVRYT